MTELELINREMSIQGNDQDVHSAIDAVCVRTNQYTQAELLAAYDNQYA